MINRRDLFLAAGAAAGAATVLTALPAAAAEAADLPRREVELVAPPHVHAHEQATSRGPEVVAFKMTIIEKEHVIDDDGAKIHAFTYNGSIPGPLMVVHEGDYLELTLVNPPTNAFDHNIDFHASTGGLGGGELTHINPGEEVTLRFKATRAGVFIYHCAPEGPMIPWHVVSGMNGAALVLPRAGLSDGAGKKLSYDRIYYVGEQVFYVPRDSSGAYKTYASAADSFVDTMAVMRTLTPTHVVFNGAVGALTDKNALPAKVGETVLVIHSQANRDTRPHLIGGHGDYVWLMGKFANPPLRDLETWFVPGGSATAALYTFRQPGVYAYVNHNLIEAVLLGATAHFRVEGKWNDDLMTQVRRPTPIG